MYITTMHSQTEYCKQILGPVDLFYIVYMFWMHSSYVHYSLQTVDFAHTCTGNNGWISGLL